MATTHLAARQLIIRRQIKHVHHKLRYRIPSDPKEHRLPVLDQEQAMSYKAFTRERKKWRHDNFSIVSREAYLHAKVGWLVGWR